MKPTWRLRAMRKLVGDMVDLNSRCMFKHLMQYYCPVEVTSFVHAVVKKVIPLPMFGSIENRTVILRAMTRFIRLRRYETMSLQYVLQGFKMGDCEWLQDTQVRKLGSYVRHVPPSASIKQHEILYEFVYWLFDGFLISLLQAGFYITDSSFQRNKVFYYRHGLWRHITKPAVNLIQKNMFVKMTEDEVAWCYRGYSVVRLLPKEEGLRPIINLRKTSTRLVNGRPTSGVKSMNKQLMNAFLVMAYEQNRQLSYKSSSAIGMSDLYHRLKLVKNKLVDKSNMQVQRLFMVKVDIKKSFDSINQDKLLEIINNTLKEDQYMIHRYSKVMPANGAITKRFFPKAISQNEMPKFMDFSHNQAVISKHAVYIDKVIHTFERKGAIVNAIKNHIKENIVKFGRHFYRQTTGIPQGSILSPSLCRFFYDEMEKNILSELIQDMDSAMVRLADDFLFISRKQERATSFLQTMSMGHPDFGCFINETKTIANFDITMNGKVIPRCHGNEFPFCGMLLHSKTLEIRTDYSRYHGEDIRNLLTVGRDLHPGRSITFKMKKAMQHMCQMAFSDTTFNSHSKVMLNIYQNFVFCAMKFHAYCQELYLDPVSKEHLQPLALPSVVFGILRACYGLLHNGRRSTVGITAGVRFDIAERHVHWFGASAFCSTLPKLIIYDPLRVALQDKVLAPLNRDEKVHFKRMLHSVVNDQRNSILDDIRYK
ncbi:hypothetical protein BG011_008049 [Mortierella polycephala]|uniref:Telomerase reverse transcriptase n=1 Tax=Mortierella polycephala TaxID=41804 RepID=A0A9P6TXG3_9FUNG|nr:hypothetical protein BG011_008049 [Mortierella polycephala]